MSRTYRKYPTCRYLYNGDFYEKWDDLPERIVPVKIYTSKKEKRLERVYYDAYDEKTSKYYSYFKTELVEHYTDEFIPEWTTRRLYSDADMRYYYHEKNREGWNHNSRLWHKHGVGKENKRIRKKHHRAQARDVIKHWEKGDFSRDIPRERNHDRWDWL